MDGNFPIHSFDETSLHDSYNIAMLSSQACRDLDGFRNFSIFFSNMTIYNTMAIDIGSNSQYLV